MFLKNCMCVQKYPNNLVSLVTQITYKQKGKHDGSYYQHFKCKYKCREMIVGISFRT